jgi:plasmid stability protein
LRVVEFAIGIPYVDPRHLDLASIVVAIAWVKIHRSRLSEAVNLSAIHDRTDTERFGSSAVACLVYRVPQWSRARCRDALRFARPELTIFALGSRLEEQWRNLPMATLNIKNLPDALSRKLQARAKRDRRSVAQEVAHLLSEALEQPRALSILELQGFGKELWTGIDAAEHVRRERASSD